MDKLFLQEPHSKNSSSQLFPKTWFSTPIQATGTIKSRGMAIHLSHYLCFQLKVKLIHEGVIARISKTVRRTFHRRKTSRKDKKIKNKQNLIPK